MQYDVLVVGAGPSGLVLTCDLLMRGFSVALIEQRTEPAVTSRAIGLQPRALEILERLEAAGGLKEEAVRAVGTDIHADGRCILWLEQSFGDIAPLLIGQHRIEARLRERIAVLGGEVQWGCELVDLETGQETVSARVRTDCGDRTILASWMVGADGASSAVRRLLGLDFRGSTFPETMILADVEMCWERPHDVLASWLHPEGLLAAAPLPFGRWRLFAEVSDGDPLAELLSAGVSADHPDAAGELTRLFRQRSGMKAGEVQAVDWTSVFRFHQRIVDRFSAGRCFLVGDAAHAHSAQGAQGMNLGIGDAYNLGWKIAAVREGAHPRLLDTYSEERRPVAAAIVRRTSAGWRITLGNSAPARALRDLLVLPLMRLKAVQRRLARTASQLDITYAGGPLAPRPIWQALMDRQRPQAGDRAPDAPLVALADAEDTMLSRLTGPGWALVTFDLRPMKHRDRAVLRGLRERGVRCLAVQPAAQGMARHPDGLATFTDADGDARRAYRPRPREWVLIRPDGHIGVRAGKLVTIERWLETTFAHGRPSPGLGTG